MQTSTTLSVVPAADAGAASPLLAQIKRTLRSWPVMIAIVVLLLLVGMAVFAPWLGTTDPSLLDSAQRLKPISAAHWLGTDAFGRDVFSRVLYGGRVSLTIGLGAVIISLTSGLFIGVTAGYFRLA